MRKIKKGDQVVVVSGRDKGKKGKIMSVAPFEKNGIITTHRVKVEGVQMVKKTMKPNPQKGISGGIVEKESWIDISNVAILNPISQKRDKVKIKLASKVDANGKTIDKKVRHFKSNDELVDIT